MVDDEMEAQYKKVYKKAMQGHDSSAQINLVRGLPSSLVLELASSDMS